MSRLGLVTAALAMAVVVALPASGAAAAAAAPASGPVRLVTIQDSRITESSGLAASPSDPSIVWTVNDSGDSARAFAVSLRTGRTVAVLTERTDARDCEAMTSGRDRAGRPLLWIGDIGDNRADRTSVVVRLVHEPDPLRSVTVTPVSLRVRYPGGPSDAETLMWTPDGRLLIATKGLFGSTIYQVPPAAVRTALAGHSVSTPALARKVGTVPQVLVTDGVALPDGRLVVRDYLGAVVYAPPAYDGQALHEQARITLPVQQQGETMALLPGARTLAVGSEGLHQPLWRVAVPAATAAPTATATAGGTRSSSTAAGSGAGPSRVASPPAASGRGWWPGIVVLVAAGGLAAMLLVLGVRARRRERRSPPLPGRPGWRD